MCIIYLKHGDKEDGTRLFLVVFNEWKRDSGHRTFKIRKHFFTIRVIGQQDQFAQTGCGGSILEGLQGLNGRRPE